MTESANQKVTKQVNLIEDDAAPLADYNGSKDGKPVFQTRDLDEWREYAIKKKLININGSKPCAICGIKVEYEEMPVFEKPLCDTCFQNTQAYGERVKLKKQPKQIEEEHKK